MVYKHVTGSTRPIFEQIPDFTSTSTRQSTILETALNAQDLTLTTHQKICTELTHLNHPRGRDGGEIKAMMYLVHGECLITLLSDEEYSGNRTRML